MNHWIKNWDKLATTPTRTNLLTIAEAGLNAIDTDQVIKSSIKLDGTTLTIKDRSFDLTKFKQIKVVGFGKVSCKAAFALEQILGAKIDSGIAIGIAPVACEYIKTYQGNHPEPTEYNVSISEQILKMSEAATENDLVITIVSGGGSSLLCWPLDECRQAHTLYENFLTSGGTIQELNTIRKHISLLKGGGLAKALYPATVAAIIFSDVPDNDFDSVASGPTYLDLTTVQDAQKIIDKYHLGDFRLNETPKDSKYFEKVHNIPLVSNHEALLAMQKQAQILGYESKILSEQVKEEAVSVIETFQDQIAPKTCLLAGGEISLQVTKPEHGGGGRNLYLSMQALTTLKDNQAFLSIASDGSDNSDALGGIADSKALQKLAELKLSPQEYLENYNGYSLFKQLESMVMTGPTNANVADLMIFLQN